jgi:hypothetical protein
MLTGLDRQIRSDGVMKALPDRASIIEYNASL